MKTIEEAAKEYAEKLNYSMEAKHNMCPMDFEISFKKGIAFAEEWISVEDELPENSIEIIFKTKEGRVYSGFYGLSCNFYATLTNILGNNIMIDKVTHWRPINRK